MTSAEILKFIHMAEEELPVHRDWLRPLQQQIFAPHSYARGHLKSNGATQRRHDQMVINIGYAIMAS